jgi:hypothetical protein
MNNTKRVASWLVSEFVERNNGFWQAERVTENQMMQMIEKTSLPLSAIAGISKIELLNAINCG